MADTDRGILTEGAPLESYAYGEQSRGAHIIKLFISIIYFVLYYARVFAIDSHNLRVHTYKSLM